MRAREAMCVGDSVREPLACECARPRGDRAKPQYVGISYVSVEIGRRADATTQSNFARNRLVANNTLTHISAKGAQMADNADDETPESFICPLTLEIMTDPVTAADGHSYECAAITAWLRSSALSPLTGEQLPH